MEGVVVQSPTLFFSVPQRRWLSGVVLYGQLADELAGRSQALAVQVGRLVANAAAVLESRGVEVALAAEGIRFVLCDRGSGAQVAAVSLLGGTDTLSQVGVKVDGESLPKGVEVGDLLLGDPDRASDVVVLDAVAARVAGVLLGRLVATLRSPAAASVLRTDEEDAPVLVVVGGEENTVPFADVACRLAGDLAGRAAAFDTHRVGS